MKKQLDIHKDLRKCKHCKTELLGTDIKTQSKKKLTERYGAYWMGIEKPYIQVYKAKCPNPRCRKEYTVREKGSDWDYS